jgi:hypothetical protein
MKEKGSGRLRISLFRLLFGVTVACVLFALVAFFYRRTGNLLGSAVLVAIIACIGVVWHLIDNALSGATNKLLDKAIRRIFGANRTRRNGSYDSDDRP